MFSVIFRPNKFLRVVFLNIYFWRHNSYPVTYLLSEITLRRIIRHNFYLRRSLYFSKAIKLPILNANWVYYFRTFLVQVSCIQRILLNNSFGHAALILGIYILCLDYVVSSCRCI